MNEAKKYNGGGGRYYLIFHHSLKGRRLDLISNTSQRGVALC